MKKAFYYLCLFVCFSFLPSAALSEFSDVGNFEDFNAAVGASSSTVEIGLSDNITVSGELNIQNADKLHIEGNNYFINGDNFGTSFKTGEGQTIIFSAVTVSSFNIVAENSALPVTGGVINSSGALEVLNATFSSNSVTSSNFTGNAFALGGAVYSDEGSVLAGNSLFYGNKAIAVSSAGAAQALGGGVYNSGTFNISASSFTKNSARTTISVSSDTEGNDFSGHSFGGAVYNEASFTAGNAFFGGNYALSESYGEEMKALAYGGAVYNDSFMNINDSFFENNYASAAVSAQSSTVAAAGGAVYAGSTAVFNIINSSFSANSAAVSSGGQQENNSAYGGAVYNAGVTNVYNSSFINNKVSAGGGAAYGGAVFNASGAVLNIIAGGEDVEFTGNTAGGKSNAIYNNDETSVINLNAAAGNKIVINDAIGGGSGEININQAGMWDSSSNPETPDNNKLPDSAPIDGVIEVNNSVTGNNIVLHNGTLYLGVFESTTYLGNKIAASRGSIGTESSRNDLTMNNSSVLDMANGIAGDIIYVNNFTVNGASKLNIEVDPANSAWDRIDASNATSGTGTLDISDLKILSDFTSGVSLDAKIFVNPSSIDYFQNPDFLVYRYNTDVSSSIYHITQTADYGTLNILLEGYSNDTFQAAIVESSPARTLQLESDYYTADTYNPVIEAGSLTVRGGGATGNAVTIDGAGLNEIFVLQNDSVGLQASNVIMKSGYAQHGGAVYNAGSVLLSGVTFSSNIAQSSDAQSNGGAVYNSGSFIAKNTVFSNNIARSTAASAAGGAFYNAHSATASIYNVSFTGNFAEGQNAAGGAIYNEGILNIVADGGNVEFSGNTANGISNAVHNSGGAVLNLNAGSGIISFNDSITSEGDNNIININLPFDIEIGELNSLSLAAAPVNGTVIINADMRNFGNLNSASGNAVNVYNGTLKLGADAVFFDNAEVNMFAGTEFDMRNGKIDTVSVNDFNLPDGNVDISVDVDLKNAKADNFAGTRLIDDTGTLTIKNISLLTDVSNLEKHVNILIADDENLKNSLFFDDSVKKVMGPIFIYDVNFGNGNLGFEYTADYNPSIFIAPISMKLGGYLGQLNAYNQAFDIMHDTVNGLYRRGVWVKPYGYDEDIELNRDLTVSNTAYGAFFGYDTKMSDLGRNFEGNFSIYGAYNASTLKYHGSEINQDGGLVGVTMAIYKENFFTAFTANLGIISEHGKGSHGKDDFMMYTKGIASKTGYNFVLNYEENLKLQPTFNISCSSIDMDNYLNGAEVEIKSAGMVPINIEPAVSLAADLKNDLMAFINLSMSWNIYDNSEFTAGDVILPDLDIDPYMQYGIGFSKALGERFSAKGEVYGRSLGRSGVGGQLNLRWAF